MRLWVVRKGLGGNQGLVTAMLIAQTLWFPNSEPLSTLWFCIFQAEFFPSTPPGLEVFLSPFFSKETDSERPSTVTQRRSLGTSKSLLIMVWGGAVIIIIFFCQPVFSPVPSLPACYHLPGEFASVLGPRGPIRGLLQRG